MQDGQQIDQIANDLNAGTIPQALRDAFSAIGITLSDQVSVEVVKAGAEWRITDQGRVFIIRLDNGTLNIYQSRYETILSDELGLAKGRRAWWLRIELDRWLRSGS